MKRKQNKKWEPVKIDSVRVELLRKNKEETGVPIATFVEKAIDEKIEREKIKTFKK